VSFYKIKEHRLLYGVLCNEEISKEECFEDFKEE